MDLPKEPPPLGPERWGESKWELHAAGRQDGLEQGDNQRDQQGQRVGEDARNQQHDSADAVEGLVVFPLFSQFVPLSRT